MYLKLICPYWLTLTWDVFKWDNLIERIEDSLGLTLTWDVFKYDIINYVDEHVKD